MTFDSKTRAVQVLKVTALAALLGTSGVVAGYHYTESMGAAYADEDGDGGQGAQGPGSGGGQGQGGPGSQSGQGNQGGQGSGQGGPGPDSDGKGPQAGGPTGSGGGKPAWAQEGIPEVELGRLNVARSPDQVLDRAYAEALASLTADMISFYSLSLEEMISEFSLNWDNITILDSPLQNLALLKDALDGSSQLTSLGVSNDIDTLMAAFLGVASDKAVPISADTVIAVTTILGQPITGADAAALAADAEAIRIAVLAGHG